MNVIKALVLWVIAAVVTIIGTNCALMFTHLMEEQAVSSGAQLGTDLFSLALLLICLYFVIKVFIIAPCSVIKSFYVNVIKHS